MNRRRLTTTLALALCFCAAAGEPSPSLAAAKLTAAAVGAVDGVARRAPARRSKRRAHTARKGKFREGAERDVAYRAEDAPPPVAEVDAEGLKKLLGRGDDPAKARPLLVNFWATWCDPCREEFPDLVRVDAEFRPRGLDFITVSADDVSELKTGVPAFLRKMNATMPSYILNTPNVEAAMSLVDPRWGGELPATFLLDREGKVVFKHFGRVKLAELRPAIEKVLGGK